MKVILDSDESDEGGAYNIDELNKTYSKVIIAKATRIDNPSANKNNDYDGYKDGPTYKKNRSKLTSIASQAVLM